MVDMRLSIMVEVLLKVLNCHHTNSLKPKFGVLCKLISGHYLHLLPIVQSQKWVIIEHDNGC